MNKARRRRFSGFSLAVFLLIPGMVCFILLPYSAGASPIAATTTSTTTPAAAASPVTLQGEGPADLQDEDIAWSNALFGKNGNITLHYLDTTGAGFQARQDLISGSVDFAVSGVPFQPSELAQLPGGAADVIGAPVFVSAVGALLALPAWGVAPGTKGSPSGQTNFPGFQIQTTSMYCFDTSSTVANGGCSDDPTCQQYQTLLSQGIFEPCTNVDLPYTGPVNVPSEELASMIFHPNGETRVLWQNPAIEAAFSVDTAAGDILNPLQTPLAILQSEKSELNYYAQQFAATAAPDVWAEVLKMANEPAGTPISEGVPDAVVVSGRTTEALQGIAKALGAVDSQLLQYAADPSATGTPNTFAILPPQALHDALAEAPKAAVQWIAVANAAGQYETPSPASIDAAVNAGGNVPLYALTHSVKGAYPLTYVDDLYVLAHGLSMAKTDAIATTIRYMATAGQEATAQYGDGRLPPAQVTEALKAANKVVTSNCTGKGETIVVSSNPGPYMPAFPAGSVQAKDIAAIGPMDVCGPPSSPSGSPKPPGSKTGSPGTGTTSPGSGPGSTGTPLGGGGTALLGSTSPLAGGLSGAGSGSGVGSSSGSPTTGGGGAAGGGSGPHGQGSRPVGLGTNGQPLGTSGRGAGASLVGLGLPLPLPGSGRLAYDTLSGLVIGALLLLALRRPGRWVLNVLRVNRQ